jgi:hypothetical protein
MKKLGVLLLTMAVFATAADQVPFVATFTSAAPGGNLPTCNADFPVPIALVGNGYATHLGLFTETQSHCVNPQTLEFALGQSTFTSANGDTVSGTYSGHLVITGPTTAAIYGVFLLTSGTGRFSGATGGGGANGTLDLVTGRADDLLLRGTISRPNR